MFTILSGKKHDSLIENKSDKFIAKKPRHYE